MNRKICILVIFIMFLFLSLSLYGFASAEQYPIYTGSISFVSGSSSSRPVLLLSGSVDIWLNDYSTLTISEDSHLLNAGTNQLIGEIRHSSGVYDIRMPAGADYIQVYQRRESSSSTSYTYFNYNLSVDDPPSTLTDSTRILWFIASFFIVLIPLIVIGRFIL